MDTDRERHVRRMEQRFQEWSLERERIRIRRRAWGSHRPAPDMLEDAGAGGWDELRKGLDTAWKQMRSALRGDRERRTWR